MTYPNGRVLTYDYRTTGSPNDQISRLSGISDYGSGDTLESHQYLGLGTVVVRAHPVADLTLTYVAASGTGDAGDQYTGLDRFGRVADQKWVQAGGKIWYSKSCPAVNSERHSFSGG